MIEKENLFSGLEVMSPEETMAIGNNEVVEKDEKDEETTLVTSKEEIENTDSIGDDLTINTPVPGSEKNDTSEDSTDNSAPASATVYAALIKQLGDDGVVLLPEDEAELTSLLENADVNTLKSIMTKTVEGSVESKQEAWKKGLNPSQKRFLEIEGSFEDTDTAIQMAQRLEYFDNLSVDNIKNDATLQANLYYEALKSKNFSHEDAIEAIDEARSLGKLEEKSIKALGPLKASTQNIVDSNKEMLQKERVKMQEDNEAAYTNLMTNIDNTESLVEGLKLNKVAREKLKSNIVNPVFTTKEGEKLTSLMYKQRKNPERFDMIVNYYDTLGLFDIDKDGSFKPNLSKLKTIAKTTAVSELDNVLNSQNTTLPGQGNSTNTTKESAGVLDFLERATGQTNRKK